MWINAKSTMQIYKYGIWNEVQPSAHNFIYTHRYIYREKILWNKNKLLKKNAHCMESPWSNSVAKVNIVTAEVELTCHGWWRVTAKNSLHSKLNPSLTEACAPTQVFTDVIKANKHLLIYNIIHPVNWRIYIAIEEYVRWTSKFNKQYTGSFLYVSAA